MIRVERLPLTSDAAECVLVDDVSGKRVNITVGNKGLADKEGPLDMAQFVFWRVAVALEWLQKP